MLHKTDGTNARVLSQGFISAHKKYFYILDHLKIRENRFWLMLLQAISACHFEG